MEGLNFIIGYIVISFFETLQTVEITSVGHTKSFTIDYKNDCFLKDNEPFRYISGGIHYFRVPRAYWNDRLRKAKALGLNAIQTYIAWNIHEPSPGKFDFEGENDLLHFIKLCQQNDLLVILRPGPYIDAEWEYGGFPWWLTKYVKEFRTSHDDLYMEYVNVWLRVLLMKLKPLLYKYSGPIIAMQVENEYGNYYACDHQYMQELKEIYDKYLGKDSVILFTTDGYGFGCGSLPSLYTTIDFGISTKAEEEFKKQRKFQPHGPLVNSEYYTGWQDFWGYPHSRRDSAKVAQHLDTMLALNASVNLYMFHGGTNFGFMNGNDNYYNDGFLMAPTTYDYDAPLTEAGDPNSKYFAIRDVIKKYTSGPLLPVPKASKKAKYGKIHMSSSISLSQFVLHSYPHGSVFHSVAKPLSMEEVNQAYGFILYRTTIPPEQRRTLVTLSIDNVHDRCVIFVDGKRQAIVKRGAVHVTIHGGEQLDILVENQGRLCYGSRGMKYLPDPKGIIGHVRLNSKILKNWTMFPLDESKFLRSFQWATLPQTMHVDMAVNKHKHSHMFFTTSFVLTSTSDTFIKMNGWTKGQIFINSFNIGRYWQLEKGPQKTLYVPKTALHVGKNHLLVMELDKAPCNDGAPQICFVEFVDKPILI